MVEYNKIETVYERSEGTKKLIEGLFRNEAAGDSVEGWLTAKEVIERIEQRKGAEE